MEDEDFKRRQKIFLSSSKALAYGEMLRKALIFFTIALFIAFVVFSISVGLTGGR